MLREDWCHSVYGAVKFLHPSDAANTADNHSLKPAPPHRLSPACTDCSLPLRSWDLALLLQGGKFPPSFPQVAELLHTLIAWGSFSSHFQKNTELVTVHFTPKQTKSITVSSSYLIPDRVTATRVEPHAVLQQKLLSKRSHNERQAWLEPLSSPGRSTLVVWQPQFFIISLGSCGMEGLKVYPMFLNTLSNVWWETGNQPILCILHCQLGEDV